MTEPAVTQWGKARAVSIFRALSLLGSELTVFALVLRERNHGAAFVSLLLAAGTISLIAVVPFAGWISDRFSTQQIIPLTSLLQASLILSLLFQHNKLSILVTIFLSSSCGAVENPTFMALIPTLVRGDDLMKQSGFSQSVYAIAGLTAPAFGGILVSQTGYKTPFIVDAATFLILGAAPTLLKVNRRSTTSEMGEKVKAADGMRYIFADKYLRALAILISGFLLAAGTVSVANVFLLTKVLHASVLIFGMAGVASALGSMAGGVILMKFRISENSQTRIISAILLASGLIIILVSVARHWLMVIVLEFLLGVLFAILTALVSTIFIQRSPADLRGRIGAALNAFLNIGMVGSLLIAGPLIDWLGVRTLLFWAGIASIILVALLSPATFKSPAPGR